MDWQDQLIYVYLNVCEYFSQLKKEKFLRASPNFQPIFTDEEVITIYVFGIMQHLTCVKQIHFYFTSHLVEWFPNMPKYEAFSHRLNFLEQEFLGFCEFFIQRLNSKEKHHENIVLIDSLPIMLARGFRSQKAQVAKEVTSQGYCSSKDVHYHGVKLHLFADYAEGTLPIPRLLSITKAKTHDLTAAKDFFPEFSNCKMIGDKAYRSAAEKEKLKNNCNEIHTPVKLSRSKKSLTEDEKVYSKIISAFRQPIEIFFNWLIEKTGIQIASKVRSYKGLMVHIFGRVAAALVLYELNF